MRVFIIFSFAALASAAPQYNYQSSSEFTGNSGIINGGLSLLSSPESNLGAAGSGSSLNSFQDSGVPTEYNKQYYFHQAPEDEFNDNEANEKIATSLKKNLQVVFIKSPENKGLENAALQLAKQAGEDKTAIYVLNKQTDISELAERLQQLKENNPNKPEVHFVKYKTPEEAENAKQQIQAQYDNLPGPSRVSNEGIAPVLNFIRSQGTKTGNGYSSINSNNNVGGFNEDISTSYLPPNSYLSPNQYLPIKY